MIKTEMKEVTRTTHEYIPVKGVCDGCGKEFALRKYDHSSNNEYYDYYRIITHHHNWANDSCESYEAKDFCCMDCMMNFIRNYWEGKRKCDVGRMTHHMEIKHMLRLEEYRY